jgi:hypothetical protein
VKNGWTRTGEGGIHMPGILLSDSFQKGPLRVIMSIEEHQWSIQVKHVSVSCRDRYPTWDEILDVRESFFEDRLHVAQMLPPKAQYVNVHKNCFHLWAKLNGEPWQ